MIFSESTDSYVPASASRAPEHKMHGHETVIHGETASQIVRNIVRQLQQNHIYAMAEAASEERKRNFGYFTVIEDCSSAPKKATFKLLRAGDYEGIFPLVYQNGDPVTDGENYDELTKLIEAVLLDSQGLQHKFWLAGPLSIVSSDGIEFRRMILVDDQDRNILAFRQPHRKELPNRDLTPQEQQVSLKKNEEELIAQIIKDKGTIKKKSPTPRQAGPNQNKILPEQLIAPEEAVKPERSRDALIELKFAELAAQQEKVLEQFDISAHLQSAWQLANFGSVGKSPKEKITFERQAHELVDQVSFAALTLSLKANVLTMQTETWAEKQAALEATAADVTVALDCLTRLTPESLTKLPASWLVLFKELGLDITAAASSPVENASFELVATLLKQNVAAKLQALAKEFANGEFQEYKAGKKNTGAAQLHAVAEIFGVEPAALVKKPEKELPTERKHSPLGIITMVLMGRVLRRKDQPTSAAASPLPEEMILEAIPDFPTEQEIVDALRPNPPTTFAAQLERIQQDLQHEQKEKRVVAQMQGFVFDGQLDHKQLLSTLGQLLNNYLPDVSLDSANFATLLDQLPMTLGDKKKNDQSPVRDFLAAIASTARSDRDAFDEQNLLSPISPQLYQSRSTKFVRIVRDTNEYLSLRRQPKVDRNRIVAFQKLQQQAAQVIGSVSTELRDEPRADAANNLALQYLQAMIAELDQQAAENRQVQNQLLQEAQQASTVA